MDVKIDSIQTFMDAIHSFTSKWDPTTTPWFRGEPGTSRTPLLPTLYRRLPHGSKYNENRIVQNFRRMAPAFTEYKAPDKRETDEWLFLMQHLRVPTRLLDWTEGALIGLYFALECKRPAVWMLNPDELNQLSTSEKIIPGAYPITWYRPTNGTTNIGEINIRGAWELDQPGVDLPVAVKPTYLHPRMRAQKSCFTVHGKKKESLSKIVPDSIVIKFLVDENAIPKIRHDLTMLGVTHTSVFPEAEYLAREVKESAIVRKLTRKKGA